MRIITNSIFLILLFSFKSLAHTQIIYKFDSKGYSSLSSAEAAVLSYAKSVAPAGADYLHQTEVTTKHIEYVPMVDTISGSPTVRYEPCGEGDCTTDEVIIAAFTKKYSWPGPGGLCDDHTIINIEPEPQWRF